MREALPQDLLDTGLLQDDDVDVGRNSGKVRAKSRAYRRPESDEQGLTRSPVFDRTGVDTAAHKDMDPPRTCGRRRRQRGVVDHVPVDATIGVALDGREDGRQRSRCKDDLEASTVLSWAPLRVS
jgi:hypothetical protein